MRGDPNAPVWRWLAAGAALAALIVALMLRFPDAARDPGDWSAVAYSVGLVCVLLAGGLGLGRGGLGKGLRYGAIWLAIFGGLTLLITFLRDAGG